MSTDDPHQPPGLGERGNLEDPGDIEGELDAAIEQVLGGPPLSHGCAPVSGPDPEVARVRLALRAALADLAPGTLVLVGCSGGADSLALAAATAFVAPRLHLRAGAVVVDHDLADGSARVAARAAAQCRELGLDPVIVERVEVAAQGGVEGAARAARRAAFERVRTATGAAFVLLAHTMDDQAETVLLRLARGSGIRSLVGMEPEADIFRRPLLGVRRAQLRATCRALGLDWWEDPGNRAEGPLRRADGRPLPRAAVRENVLPALADALGTDPVPALARTAELARDDVAHLESQAWRTLARALEACDPTPDHPLHAVDIPLLAARPAPVRRRALRYWLVEAGSPAGSLGLAHVKAVDGLLTRWRGQVGVDVPGGLRVSRRGDRLVVERLPSA